MEYYTAIALLNSETVHKQITALSSIIPLLKRNIPPTESVIVAIIEHGLSSEKSHEVKFLSFKCIQLLYQTRVSHWPDVRSAILTEIGTAENSKSLSSALDVLTSLPQYEQIGFVTSKEGMAIIKSSFLFPDPGLRSVAIEKLGSLLINIWVSIETDISLEGYIKVDTISEMRQLKEDLKYTIIDSLEGFAKGILGKAPSAEPGHLLDDVQLSAMSCCQIIAMILKLFNRSKDMVSSWTDSLLAVTDTQKPFYQRREQMEVSASLSRLLKPVLPQLLQNPYVLLSRWRRQLSGARPVASCISQIVILLLHEHAPGSSSVVGVDVGVTASSHFSSAYEATDTAEACMTPVGVNIVQFATEWMGHLTTSVLRVSADGGEILEAAQDILTIGQDTRCAIGRLQYYPFVTEHLLRLLTLERASKHGTGSGMTSPTEIMALVLLAARFSPRETVLAPLSTSICRALDNADVDDVSRTRLLAELSSLLLTEPANGGKVAHPACLEHLLADHWLSDALGYCSDSGIDTDDASTSATTNMMMMLTVSRLSTALMRVASRLIVRLIHNNPSSSSSKEDTVRGSVGTPGTGHGTGYGTGPSGDGDEEDTEMDLILSSSLLLLKRFSSCLTWPGLGLVGDVSAVTYRQLLRNVLCALTPTARSNNNNIIQPQPLLLPSESTSTSSSSSQSFKWAIVELRAIVTKDLISHVIKDIKTSAGRIQLLNIIVMYLPGLYQGYLPSSTTPTSSLSSTTTPSTIPLLKGTLSKLIVHYRNILMVMDKREAFRTQLLASAATGKLGGGSYDTSPHSYAYVRTQTYTLRALEILADSCTDIIPDVLLLLNDFRTCCQQELTDRGQDDLSILLLKQAELTSKRVMEICPDISRDWLTAENDKHNQNHHPTSPSVSKSTQSQSESNHNWKRMNETELMNRVTTRPETVMRSLTLPPIDTGTPTPSLSQSLMTPMSDQCDDTEADDVGLVFGLFSNEMRSGMCRPNTYVCSTDIFAVIDDVMDAHSTSSSSGKGGSSGAQDPHPHPPEIEVVTAALQTLHVTLDDSDSDMCWDVVSGSTDPLTVQVQSLPDPASLSCIVRVRVINTAGFKIPDFAIQLTLLTEDNDDTMQCVHGHGATIGSPNSLCVAPGAEYFSPGAMLERQFTVNLSRFASFCVVVRLLYPDITLDDPKAVFVQPVARNPAAFADEDTQHTQTQMSGGGGNTTRMTVAVDCDPALLPSQLFLVPYGAGAISAMAMWTSGNNLIHGGIPKSVFVSLWDRLVDGMSVPIFSCLPSDLEALPLCDAIRIAGQRSQSTTGSSMWTASRVKLGDCGSTWSVRFVATMGWCCHSWWGTEVAIRLTATKGSYAVSASGQRCVLWTGRLEVRASEQRVLSALMTDVDAFLGDLAFGLLERGSSSEEGWGGGGGSRDLKTFTVAPGHIVTAAATAAGECTFDAPSLLSSITTTTITSTSTTSSLI